jgi:hypothetical protein
MRDAVEIVHVNRFFISSAHLSSTLLFWCGLSFSFIFWRYNLDVAFSLHLHCLNCDNVKSKQCHVRGQRYHDLLGGLHFDGLLE